MMRRVKHKKVGCLKTAGEDEERRLHLCPKHSFYFLLRRGLVGRRNRRAFEKSDKVLNIRTVGPPSPPPPLGHLAITTAYIIIIGRELWVAYQYSESKVSVTLRVLMLTEPAASINLSIYAVDTNGNKPARATLQTASISWFIYIYMSD